MNKKLAFLASVAVVGLPLLTLVGCSQSDKVSNNIANDADNFKVRRRVVVINTRTDKVEAEAEGIISVDIDDKRIDIIAKTGPDSYKKDIINLTGNNMYSVTQLEDSKVDPYKYEFTWLPESVVPIKVKGE